MARPKHGTRVELPAALVNPLDFAICAQDRATIDMVREAVRHRQVLLAYQPVIQARMPGRIAYHEGLIRVLDARGRVIPARDFIAAIEETETGRIIDCLALELGLRALARDPGLRLAINMSARSVGYGRWMRVLDRGLARDATLAERLILEITESSAMLVPELVIGFMRDMQARGISFALDDFGAGHTSFRYFKQFHFDILKIDGQFIRGVSSDPDNQVLVSALIAIGQQFDMFTVAETVERAADADWLARNGIDCMQGYFFGAPTTAPPRRAAEPVRIRA